MSEHALLEIPNLTPAEKQWVCEVIRMEKSIRGIDHEEDYAPFQEQASDLGLNFDEDEFAETFTGFNIECHGNELVVTDDNGGWDTEHAVAFVCSFLKRFRPEETAELNVGWDDDDGPPGGFRKMVNKDGFVVESPPKQAVSVGFCPEDIIRLHDSITLEEAQKILGENKERIETVMTSAGNKALRDCLGQFLQDRSNSAAPRP
jgi:hypothetical protein